MPLLTMKTALGRASRRVSQTSGSRKKPEDKQAGSHRNKTKAAKTDRKARRAPSIRDLQKAFDASSSEIIEYEEEPRVRRPPEDRLVAAMAGPESAGPEAAAQESAAPAELKRNEDVTSSSPDVTTDAPSTTAKPETKSGGTSNLATATFSSWSISTKTSTRLATSASSMSLTQRTRTTPLGNLAGTTQRATTTAWPTSWSSPERPSPEVQALTGRLRHMHAAVAARRCRWPSRCRASRDVTLRGRGVISARLVCTAFRANATITHGCGQICKKKKKKKSSTFLRH